MEAFADLDLDTIASRYKENELKLAIDLRAAGLLPPVPPRCHGAAMVHRPLRPWVWRCVQRECQREQSILMNKSFLMGTKKPHDAFKALCLWAHGFSADAIIKFSGLSKNTVNKLLRGWRKAVSKVEEVSGEKADLYEADETFLSRRKYHRGKKMRKTGAVTIQTVLSVKKGSKGKRTGHRVKAMIISDRTKETLLGNIRKIVPKGKEIQTDGLRSYRSLPNEGYKHSFVCHNKTFVTTDGKKKIHSNTIENAHSIMKKTGRKLNLFVGQSHGPGLEEKVAELMFRYNNRGNTDIFLIVLCFMLFAYPCCGKNLVRSQIISVLSL